MKIDDLVVIKNLIIQNENEQIEFKETPRDSWRQRYGNALCFSQRGRLEPCCIGRKRTKKIIGLDLSDKDKKKNRDIL